MADAFASQTPFAGKFLASASGAAVFFAAALLWPQSTGVQSREAAAGSALASCDEFLPPRQQVGDKLVGPG
jgi:hypothetical protein